MELKLIYYILKGLKTNLIHFKGNNNVVSKYSPIDRVASSIYRMKDPFLSS